MLNWPGLYDKKNHKAIILNVDDLGDYEVLSVLDFSLCDSDVFMTKVPDYLQSSWKSALELTNNNTKEELIMKHVFEKQEKTVIDRIEAENNDVAPDLPLSTKSFLAKGLISLKPTGIVFDDNRDMLKVEEDMECVFDRDKIENVDCPIEFSKKLFLSYKNNNPTPLLSPLYALQNMYFEQNSEMNYQETLSILFAYLISISNGNLASTEYVHQFF
ncbi:predicted protein [Naegleria gruberi]|uniref:Predicted protein n=1 Tax=Naegleria gruberi TaxID=5762 RepID=D2VYC9_NAEGR|nr:uncharacterized protein NAEGRDRAFT_74075 [Naegleria gruberi]EFC38185.1 predicted protein [Naegleria gruberi]|eukprot:XP_002670929.1 predicted protein [Naegleria gruberi strain NEG-M]